jgi:hypothetical protein
MAMCSILLVLLCTGCVKAGVASQSNESAYAPVTQATYESTTSLQKPNGANDASKPLEEELNRSEDLSSLLQEYDSQLQKINAQKKQWDYAKDKDFMAAFTKLKDAFIQQLKQQKEDTKIKAYPHRELKLPIDKRQFDGDVFGWADFFDTLLDPNSKILGNNSYDELAILENKIDNKKFIAKRLYTVGTFYVLEYSNSLNNQVETKWFSTVWQRQVKPECRLMKMGYEGGFLGSNTRPACHTSDGTFETAYFMFYKNQYGNNITLSIGAPLIAAISDVMNMQIDDAHPEKGHISFGLTEDGKYIEVLNKVGQEPLEIPVNNPIVEPFITMGYDQ